MILSFDKFERYELPQVTLCNPNSRATEVDGKITITDTVGVLSNPKGMNLKLNFNAPHELSFDYYRHKSSDPIKQSFYDSIYEAIQTDRYIYLTDIGYFTISSVTDSDEDNIDKKSISLKSCEENELATAEGLHLKEGTYYLHTENNDGLLDLFLPKTAGWTIGYIDPSLLTKPYFVEETEVDNGYNFLYTTIQNMFECIVEPDIIRRTISVYSRVYYAEYHLTDIHIAKYNLLKHKTVEENDEDKYTALNVQGKDENLEIRVVNPTGKNVIYNFEPRYSWMSPALQVAVTKWQEKCESVEEEYLTLQQGYYNDMQNIVFPLEEDIKVLELQLKEKEQTRDTIVYGDYDKDEYDEIQEEALKQVNTEIQNTSTQISDEKAQLKTEKNKIETNYSQPISNINSDCALDITAKDIDGNTIFTADLLNELMTHIKPTDYVDEYMLVTESMTYPQRFEKAKELMDRAQSQLVKISSGQKTYSIDTRSFLFNKQFKHFSEQLCTGAIIYVETKSDTMEQLHLTGIDINFDEKSTNFTLGNKYDRSDLKALYEDALGQNSKSFSELKYIASIIEDQQKQLDYQRNWIADLRTLTLDNVLTSEDQAFEINNRGLIGRKRQLNEDGSWKFDENNNPLFNPEQVRLINNTLVFTEDNWRTASTAVGKIAVGYNPDGSVKYSYGINGQVLIGELILGNNLVLTGTGAGIKIKDNKGSDVFYADDDGNLILSGTIFAKKGDIAGWGIDEYHIYNDSASIASNSNSSSVWAFMAGANDYTNKQSAAPFKVDFKGNIYAAQGTIGGINLYSNGLSGQVLPDTFADYKSTFRGDLTNNNNVMFTVSDYNIDSEDTRYNHVFYIPYYEELDITDDKLNINIIGQSSDDKYFIASELPTQNGSFVLYGYGEGGSCTFRESPIPGGYYLIHNTMSYNAADVTYESNTSFSIRSDGLLTASAANITGHINATSGCIGNPYGTHITLDGGNMYMVDGSKVCGMSAFGDRFAFYAGETNCAFGAIGGADGTIGTNAKFKVGHDGTLYAIDANITGTINAEAGYFGCWNIGGAHFNGQGIYAKDSSNNQVEFTPHYLYAGDGGDAMDETRWRDVVGAGKDWGNGISDVNVKNSIESLNDNYELFFDLLQPKRYKYNHGTSGRFHTGFIAQEVYQALLKAQLNSSEFAAIVNLQYPLSNGAEWMLRRDEFVSLNTWQIQKAKARITDLEDTVAELKTQIQTLTAG